MVEAPTLGSVPEVVSFKRSILFYDPNIGLVRSPFKPGEDVILHKGLERALFGELLATGFVAFGTNTSMAVSRARKDIGDTDKGNYLIKVRPNDSGSEIKGGYYLDRNHPALEGVEIAPVISVTIGEDTRTVNPDEAREMLWILSRQDFLAKAVKRVPTAKDTILQTADMIKSGQRVSIGLHAKLLDIIIALNLSEDKLLKYEEKYKVLRKRAQPTF